MSDQEEELVHRVVRHLRQPVHMDPTLDDRVMQAIEALPPHREPGSGAAWHRLFGPRRRRLSALAALGAAAVLAALAIPPARRSLLPSPAAGAGEFQFVILAPHATSVSLVGDFNDWDSARTPMHPLRADGTVWTAVVALGPGRYRYAFLVNGTQWLADPGAPAALDDEFGAPSSVVTVGGM